jgi:thiol-disulfide isomerase/thioredoxin
MLSISIGPLAMSVSLLTTIIGISVFWTLTHWLTYKTVDNKYVMDAVFRAIVVGLLVARIAFVLTLWSQYQKQWWQVFNLWDGGFLPFYGWAMAVFMLLISARGKRHITKVYLIASLVTIGITLPINLAARMYSSGIAIPQTPVIDTQGKPVNLQVFQGKPLVINYWASWCPPCRKEMPVLAAAQKEHTAISFVFINQGESTATVKEFLVSQELQLDNLFYDPASQLTRGSGIAGLPTTLFFDASGKLMDSRMGELSEASLAHYLQRLNENDVQHKENP